MNGRFDWFWRRRNFVSLFLEFSMEKKVIWKMFTQIVPELQELEVIFMPKTWHFKNAIRKLIAHLESDERAVRLVLEEM